MSRGFAQSGSTRPQAQRFAALLRDEGFDLPEALYDVESLADALAVQLAAPPATDERQVRHDAGSEGLPHA